MIMQIKEPEILKFTELKCHKTLEYLRTVLHACMQLYSLFLFSPTFVAVFSCPPFKTGASVSSINVVALASIFAGIFRTFIDVYGLEAYIVSAFNLTFDSDGKLFLTLNTELAWYKYTAEKVHGDESVWSSWIFQAITYIVSYIWEHTKVIAFFNDVTSFFFITNLQSVIFGFNAFLFGLWFCYETRKFCFKIVTLIAGLAGPSCCTTAAVATKFIFAGSSVLTRVVLAFILICQAKV